MTKIQERKAQLRTVWSETTWEEVAAFIGPNADKFRSTWEKQRARMLGAGSGIAWSFCWPAFLLSFVWFFYRKQWLVAVMLIVVPLILAYVIPDMKGAGVGIGIAIASMAKSLYLQDALQKITKIKNSANGDPTAAIAAAGGVSKPAGIISGIVFGLCICLVILAVVAGLMAR